MGKDKLDELIAEVFDGNEGPIKTVSDWYRDLDAAMDDVPKVVQLPDGRPVCPGSPRTCLWAGWAPGFDSFCGQCPHQQQCHPSSHALPLTEPVLLNDIRLMSFAELEEE